MTSVEQEMRAAAAAKGVDLPTLVQQQRAERELEKREEMRAMLEAEREKGPLLVPKSLDEAVDSLEELSSKVSGLKEEGNKHYFLGRVMAQHTAGKDALGEACMKYALGLKACAEADELLTLLNQQEETSVTVGEGSEARLAAAISRVALLRQALYLNLSACNLLLKEYGPALACCEAVLTVCGEGVRVAGAAAMAAEEEEEAQAAKMAAEGGVQVDKKQPRTAVPLSRLELSEEATGGVPVTEADRKCAAKAFYRRSQTRHEMTVDHNNHIDSSKSGGTGDSKSVMLSPSELLEARWHDLRAALRLCPSDKHLRLALKEVKQSLATARAKEKLRRDTEEGRRRKKQRAKKANEALLQQKQKEKEEEEEEAEEEEEEEEGEEEEEEEEKKKKKRLEAAGLAEALPPPAKSESAAPISSESGPCTKQEEACPEEECARGGQQTLPPPCEEDKEEESEEEKEAAIIRRALMEREEEQQEHRQKVLLHNGGVAKGGGPSGYRWGQSVEEVRVFVELPMPVTRRDVEVQLKRQRVRVSYKTPVSQGKGEEGGSTGQEAVRVVDALSGALSRPILVDESLWMMERRGQITLYLTKELLAEGPPGHEWWARVLQPEQEGEGGEDDGVDVTLCSALDLDGLPQHAKDRANRAAAGGGAGGGCGSGSVGGGGVRKVLNRETGEEVEVSEEEGRKMDAELRRIEEEQRSTKRRMEQRLREEPLDPKAQLWKKLSEQHPDVPITIN